MSEDGHDSGQNGRWDTPCGVHHGYVFLAGGMFGLLIACIGVVILL